MNLLNQIISSILLSTVALAAVPGARAADAGTTDLKLFEKGTNWKFIKNTGEGSFDLATDGDKPIGVLKFDFSNKTTDKTAYVLAETKVSIPDTAGEFQMNARSAVAKKITLRFVDDTGQTLQIKGSIPASGEWAPIKFSLLKKLEHWDGANDGKIHFPIKAFLISIPEPAGDTKTGQIEFADAATIAK